MLLLLAWVLMMLDEDMRSGSASHNQPDPATITASASIIDPAELHRVFRNRNSSFVIDGEAVLLGVDGRSDFNGLHSRRHDDEVQRFCSSRSRTASLRAGLADLASGMVVVFCHTSPVSVDYRSIIFQRTGKPLPRRHDRHLRAIVDG